MIDAYVESLKGYLISQLIICVLVSVFVLLVCSLAINKYKKSTVRWMAFFGLALCIAICVFSCIPGLLDVINESIIIEENVEYWRPLTEHRTTKTPFLARPHINFYIDGEKYTGTAIYGHEEDWPRGDRKGTVIYGERSKLIIDFIFTDELSPYMVESLDDARVLSQFNLPDMGEITDFEYGKVEGNDSTSYAYFIKIKIPTDLIESYDSSMKINNKDSCSMDDEYLGREYFESLALELGHIKREIKGNIIYSAYGKDHPKNTDATHPKTENSVLYIIKTDNDESYVCIYVS